MADKRVMTLNPEKDAAEAAGRIAAAAVIAVVLPEAPGMAVIGSAAALVSGLRAIGKTVSVFKPPTLARHWFPWTDGAAADNPLREFIISFDLKRSPVKELRYEKAGERLDVILSPTAGRIRREDVAFRSGALRYELVIAIGVARPEDAAASISSAPELMLEKPVVNIDVSPHNTGYGELNIVPDPGERRTLPEVIHEIMAALEVPADDAEGASALLTALDAATYNFNPERATAGSFLLAGELMRRGGLIARLQPAETSLAEAQLVSRALMRSRIDADGSTLLALLTAEDFARTAAAPDAVRAVLERLSSAVPGLKRYAIAWQPASDREVEMIAILRGQDGRLGAEPGGGTFSSFEEAREHLKQLPGAGDGVQ